MNEHSTKHSRKYWKNISVDAVVVQLDSLFHITAQSQLG